MLKSNQHIRRSHLNITAIAELFLARYVTTIDKSVSQYLDCYGWCDHGDSLG
jgi:hypothetical protein